MRQIQNVQKTEPIPRIVYTVLLLPTALVKMFIGNQYIGLIRVLCDTGAQANLLEHKIIRNYEHYSLNSNGTILGIGNDAVRIRKSIEIGFLPWFIENDAEKLYATFYVLPKSVNWAPMLPELDIPCEALPSKFEPAIADPLFWRSEPVHMLFGIELWAEIVGGCVSKLGPNLVSQDTQFSSLISGRIGNPFSYNITSINRTTNVQFINTVDSEQIFQRFWEFEDLSLCGSKNAEHELIEKMFLETYKRDEDEDGRFIITIPLKPQVQELGSSRERAMKRFFMLEKRFEQKPNFTKIMWNLCVNTSNSII